jgi:hypothetical protein
VKKAEDIEKERSAIEELIAEFRIKAIVQVLSLEDISSSKEDISAINQSTALNTLIKNNSQSTSMLYYIAVSHSFRNCFLATAKSSTSRKQILSVHICAGYAHFGSSTNIVCVWV